MAAEMMNSETLCFCDQGGPRNQGGVVVGNVQM
jgi:hypothetical protein